MRTHTHTHTHTCARAHTQTHPHTDSVLGVWLDIVDNGIYILNLLHLSFLTLRIYTVLAPKTPESALFHTLVIFSAMVHAIGTYDIPT